MQDLEKMINRKDLKNFCERSRIKKLSLFGSALRDEIQPDSDVDLLVEFEKGGAPGLITFAGMEIELSKSIGRKVDMRTIREISPYFRDEVAKQAKTVYEKT